VSRVLAVLIVFLALIDGVAHLALDLFVLHSFTRGLLSELFILDFVGYVALIVVFLVAQRSSLSLRRLVDIVLIVYPIIAILAWFYFTKGRGNPMGLGEISKPTEVLLALAALLHLTQLGSDGVRTSEAARV